MDPKVGRESVNGVQLDESPGARTSAAQEQLKARLSRKRTKTGCLTCRKRRIKCGEEHPVCRNCVKSKRHCEGYNQRVVCKQPFYDFRPGPNGAAHITFQAGLVPGPATPFYSDFAHPQGGNALYGQLQPRPVEQFVSYARQVHPPVHQTSPPQPQLSFNHHAPLNAPPRTAPPPSMPFPALQPMPPDGFSNQQSYEPLITTQHDGPSNGHYVAAGPFEMRRAFEMYEPNGAVHGMASHDIAIAPPTASLQQPPSNIPELQWIHEDPAMLKSSPNQVRETQRLPSTSAAYVPRPQLCRPTDYRPPVTSHGYEHTQPQLSTTLLPTSIDHLTPDYHEHDFHVPLTESPTQLLSQAAVEVHDDDYYDLYSDEEMDDDATGLTTTDHDPQQALGRILQGNHITIQDMQTRRYDTFLYDGMLDKYRVDEHANPSRNPATARVFAHFIAVTGPSLSIFERHPRNTSVLFTPGQVPFSQQGLWTYTMPHAALRHQGLLHAMLALASLHIARLTGASVTPSMQHYAWALKRIHHCVGHTKKRLCVTTIAATMLLGFYEIMTADHMKWNMHLAGAKQLFVEVDFAGMMQQFRRMKVKASAKGHMGKRRPSVPQCYVSQDDLLGQIPDIDERVISDIIGREVRYGDHGKVMMPQSSMPQELDLSKFEILKDLYWWYCKQDVYQSIISGNHVLMDYSRWANCPPRGPLGKPGAVYGSFDHLMLLLGRIADFSARDRARKLRQIEFNGGQWRPAPGMQMPKPPQQPPHTPMSAGGQHPFQAPTQTQPSPPQPTFFGMAPPPNPNVQMPQAYRPIHSMPTPQSAASQNPIDMRLATHAALEEYGKIRAALMEFPRRLGDAFKPLAPEYHSSLETAFGSAIFYRSFDVGCLWAIYNMAMIVALRSHPHMPPAAHMAAGVAAQQTQFHAEEIGRIVAGIVPGPPDSPLNPSLGAALCESCMPSFFAAVQYHDPRQRHETVMRIFSIAHRTGSGTAEVIANGCETAWVKAAAAGRGPPYSRVVRPRHSSDPRLNGSWERLDPNSKPDERDETDRRHVRVKAEARLNWAIGIMGTEEDDVAK